MPRTRATARLTTGGRAPRRALGALEATRRPAGRGQTAAPASAATPTSDVSIENPSHTLLDAHFLLSLNTAQEAPPAPKAAPSQTLLEPPPPLEPQVLQRIALKESLREYLCGGVINHTSRPKASMERLARELAALAHSGNSSFVELTQARVAAIAAACDKYERRLRELRSSAGSGGADDGDDLTAPVPTSGAILQAKAFDMLLGLLAATARASPAVLAPMLADIGATFLPAGYGDVNSDDTPWLKPCLSSMSAFLCRLAATPASVGGPVVPVVASTALLNVAVSTADTLGLLRLATLLLDGRLESVPFPTAALTAMRAHTTQLSLGGPFLPARLMEFSVDVGSSHVAVATDGAFLYVHNSAGLFKLSLGGSSGARGVVVHSNPDFIPGKPCSMAVVAGTLLVRSTSLLPAFAVVVDCATLTQTGTVNVDGTGSWPSVDNTAVFAGVELGGVTDAPAGGQVVSGEDILNTGGLVSGFPKPSAMAIERLGNMGFSQPVMSMMSCNNCGQSLMVSLARNTTWMGVVDALTNCSGCGGFFTAWCGSCCMCHAQDICPSCDDDQYTVTMQDAVAFSYEMVGSPGPQTTVAEALGQNMAAGGFGMAASSFQQSPFGGGMGLYTVPAPAPDAASSFTFGVGVTADTDTVALTSDGNVVFVLASVKVPVEAPAAPTAAAAAGAGRDYFTDGVPSPRVGHLRVLDGRNKLVPLLSTTLTRPLSSDKMLSFAPGAEATVVAASNPDSWNTFTFDVHCMCKPAPAVSSPSGAPAATSDLADRLTALESRMGGMMRGRFGGKGLGGRRSTRAVGGAIFSLVTIGGSGGQVLNVSVSPEGVSATVSTVQQPVVVKCDTSRLFHLAVTVANDQAVTKVSVYINGEELGTGQGAGELLCQVATMGFGGGGLDGRLCEARLWNAALPQAAVKAAMKGAVHEDAADALVLHWPMNEGMGHTLMEACKGRDASTDVGATWVPAARPALAVAHPEAAGVPLPLKAFNESVLTCDGSSLVLHTNNGADASHHLFRRFSMEGVLVEETLVPRATCGMGVAAACHAPTKTFLTVGLPLPGTDGHARTFTLSAPHSLPTWGAAAGMSASASLEDALRPLEDAAAAAGVQPHVATTSAAAAAGGDPMDGLPEQPPVVDLSAGGLPAPAVAYAVLRFLDRVTSRQGRVSHTDADMLAAIRRLLSSTCGALGAREEDPLRVYALVVALRVLNMHVSAVSSRVAASFSTGTDIDPESPSFGGASIAAMLSWLLACTPASTAGELALDAVYDLAADVQSRTVLVSAPADRVATLSALVRQELAADGDPVRAARRHLVLGRFFQSCSSADSVVQILSTQDTALPPPADVMRLLSSCTTLLLNTAESMVLTALGGGRAQATPTWMPHMLEFSLRTTVVLFGRALRHGGALLDAVRGHVIRVLSECGGLLSFCAAADRWPGEAPATAADTIAKKAAVAALCEDTVGPLCLMAATFLSQCPLDLAAAGDAVPAVKAALTAVNLLSHDLPEVVAKEAEFASGQVKWVQSTASTRVESPHPVPAGSHAYKVSLPGAAVMGLAFGRQSTSTVNQGATLCVFLDEAMSRPAVANGGNLTQAQLSTPIAVQSGEVWITVSTNYAADVWGFEVTATGTVSKSVTALPYLVDVHRGLGLVAGRLAAALVRGHPVAAPDGDGKRAAPKPAPTAWTDSPLLVGGGQPVSAADALPAALHSVVDISGQPAPAALDVDGTLKAAGAAAAALAACPVDPFPTPHDVKADVDATLQHVFAALLWHGGLVPVEVDASNLEASPGAVWAWKAAHRFKRQLHMMYQAAKMKAEEAKAGGEGGGEEEAKADGEGAGEEAVEVTRAELYAPVCEGVRARCRLLLGFLPVPPASPAPAAGPTLSRGASTSSVGGGRAAATDDEKVFLAWQTAQQASSTQQAFEEAVGEERLHLVALHVAALVSNTEFGVEDVVAALATAQTRAAYRVVGLRLAADVLACTSLASAQREVVVAVHHALAAAVDVRAADAGAAPALLAAVDGCGPPLVAAIRDAYAAVCRYVVETALGGEPRLPLVQAALNLFCLQYTLADYHAVVTGTGVIDALGAFIERLDAAPPSPAASGMQVAAWAVVDFLCSTWLSVAPGHSGAADGGMATVRTTVFASLLAKASQLRAAPGGTGPAPGSLRTGVLLPPAPSKAAKATPFSAALKNKLDTAATFGIAHAAAGGGGASGNAEDDGRLARASLAGDDDLVKLLNLTLKLCTLASGRAALLDHVGGGGTGGGPAITTPVQAAVAIVKDGTPRARFIAARILEASLRDAGAGVWSDLDAFVGGGRGGDLPGQAVARWLLVCLGQALASPLLASLTLGSHIPREHRAAVADLLASTKAACAPSDDGVLPWIALHTTARSLAATNDVFLAALAATVAADVVQALPAAMAGLEAPSGVEFALGGLHPVWVAAGGLSVLGGQQPGLFAGCQLAHSATDSGTFELVARDVVKGGGAHGAWRSRARVVHPDGTTAVVNLAETTWRGNRAAFDLSRLPRGLAVRVLQAATAAGAPLITRAAQGVSLVPALAAAMAEFVGVSAVRFLATAVEHPEVFEGEDDTAQGVMSLLLNLADQSPGKPIVDLETKSQAQAARLSAWMKLAPLTLAAVVPGDTADRATLTLTSGATTLASIQCFPLGAMGAAGPVSAHDMVYVPLDQRPEAVQGCVVVLDALVDFASRAAEAAAQGAVAIVMRCTPKVGVQLGMPESVAKPVLVTGGLAGQAAAPPAGLPAPGVHGMLQPLRQQLAALMSGFGVPQPHQLQSLAQQLAAVRGSVPRETFMQLTQALSSEMGPTFSQVVAMMPPEEAVEEAEFKEEREDDGDVGDALPKGFTPLGVPVVGVLSSGDAILNTLGVHPESRPDKLHRTVQVAELVAAGYTKALASRALTKFPDSVARAKGWLATHLALLEEQQAELSMVEAGIPLAADGDTPTGLVFGSTPDAKPLFTTGGGGSRGGIAGDPWAAFKSAAMAAGAGDSGEAPKPEVPTVAQLISGDSDWPVASTWDVFVSAGALQGALPPPPTSDSIVQARSPSEAMVLVVTGQRLLSAAYAAHAVAAAFVHRMPHGSKMSLTLLQCGLVDTASAFRAQLLDRLAADTEAFEAVASIAAEVLKKDAQGAAAAAGPALGAWSMSADEELTTPKVVGLQVALAAIPAALSMPPDVNSGMQLYRLRVPGASCVRAKLNFPPNSNFVFTTPDGASVGHDTAAAGDTIIMMIPMNQLPNIVQAARFHVVDDDDSDSDGGGDEDEDDVFGTGAALEPRVTLYVDRVGGAGQSSTMPTALAAVSVLLNADAEASGGTLLRLLLAVLNSMPRASSAVLATRCAHTATSLMRRLAAVGAPDAAPGHLSKLQGLMPKLERAHSWLRTVAMAKWTATISSPVKALMELLVAAKKLSVVLWPEAAAPGVDAGELADMHGREGPSVCSMLNLGRGEVLPTTSLASEVGNNGVSSVFAADVAVRGGKWFFEVVTEAVPSNMQQYGHMGCVSVGWVSQSKFVPSAVAASMQVLGQDAASWVLRLPSAMACHAGSQVPPPPGSVAMQANVGGFNTGFGGGMAFGGGGPFGGGGFGAAATTPAPGFTFGTGSALSATAAAEADMMAKKKTQGASGPFALGEGAVVGVGIDLDAGEMQFWLNGAPLPPSFHGPFEDAMVPIVSLMSNHTEMARVRVNLGRDAWAFPAPAGFRGLEDLSSPASSWLSRFENAADMTASVYARGALPPPVVESAFQREAQAGTDGKPLTMQLTRCSNPAAKLSPLDADDDTGVAIHVAARSPVYITYEVPGAGDDAVVIHSVKVKHGAFASGGFGSAPLLGGGGFGGGGFGGGGFGGGGFGGRTAKKSTAKGKVKQVPQAAVTATVFVSSAPPEWDVLSWCDGFTEKHFESFIGRRMPPAPAGASETKGDDEEEAKGGEGGGGWVPAPHEPVACGSVSTPMVGLKVAQPTPARFVTVKLVATGGRDATVNLTQLSFWGLPASHPLASVLSTPAYEAKAMALLEKLKAAAVDGSWTDGDDEELVQVAHECARRLHTTPRDMDVLSLAPTPEDFLRFTLLARRGASALQSRLAVVKLLNKLVTPLLSYVDIGEGGDVPDGSLSHMVTSLKALYFTQTKVSVLDALLAQDGGGATLSVAPGAFGQPRVGMQFTAPHITFNRMRAVEVAQGGGDPVGLKTMFGQLFQALRRVGYGTFKAAPPHAQLWNASLVGEGSVDVGGAFRETLTLAMGDLMDGAAGLFQLCPNGKNDVGLNRDKRILVPTATTPLQLDMFKCVGALLGMSLRTKFSLPLDLSAGTWKLIMGEALTDDDLEAVDRLCVQALGRLKAMGPEEVEAMEQTFSTRLSDGTEVPLKDGTPAVTQDNVAEYCDLVYKTRLGEGSAAVAAIRAGLETVVPLSHLALFKAFEVELLVCGDPVIDVETLRRHTTFRGGITASHPVAKNLFRALHSFTPHERRLFLQFVWGRSRLPALEADWNAPFVVNAMHATGNLPTSHTCFFSLDLPLYPSYDVLRSKLLTAITTCVAIDADFVPNGAW